MDWIGRTLFRKTRNDRKRFPLPGERIKGEGGREWILTLLWTRWSGLTSAATRFVGWIKRLFVPFIHESLFIRANCSSGVVARASCPCVSIKLTLSETHGRDARATILRLSGESRRLKNMRRSAETPLRSIGGSNRAGPEAGAPMLLVSELTHVGGYEDFQGIIGGAAGQLDGGGGLFEGKAVGD